MKINRARRLTVPLIVALLLLLLWAAGALWAVAEKQRLIAARENEMTRLTVAVEEQTLRLFKLTEVSVLSAANWIREHPQAFPAQDASFIKLVSELRRISEGALDIRLVDSTGGLHVIPAASRQPVANVADRQTVQVQRNPLTRGLFIGDPVISPVDGKWIVAITYPVERADGSELIVAAILELDRIVRLFEQQRDKPNGSITLLKANGTTLFRAPAIEGAIGKSLLQTPDFVEHLGVVERGQFRSISAFDKVDRLISHARLVSYPLIIAVTASVDDALAPWRQEVVKILVVVLLITLVTTLATWRFQRSENQSRRRLAESEQKFRSLFEHAPEAILVFDPATNRVVDVNSQAEVLFRRLRSSLLSMGVGELFSPGTAGDAAASQSIEQVVARTLDGEWMVVEGRIHAPDQTETLVEMRTDDMVEGGRSLIRASFIDITERKRAEAELRIAATAFDAQEGIVIADATEKILRVNAAFTDITGYSAEEVVGKTPKLLRSGRHDDVFYAAMKESIKHAGGWKGEIWNRRKNGEVYPEWLTITAVKDALGATVNYIATFVDISHRKTAEEEIKNLAFYDPLTGLPNRRLLLDRLRHAMASSTRSGRYGALLFIDLDNFKTLNDTLGHDVGDLLLQQVAQRLVTCVREGDTVARLGGDEFVVMLEDLSENLQEAATQVEVVGEKILSTFSQVYQLAKYEYRSTPSIGVTLFSDHQETIDELLKRADLAMYQAKAAGRNTLRFFDPQMQAVVTTRAALEADLREAVHKNQFLLYFQAQVDGQGRLTGVEALLRWQHPQRGLVSPFEFIPLAEETGLILPLGHWVLQTACAQLARWAERPEMAHLTIAVNVSARQFHHRDFVAQVLTVLDHTGANPQRLKLELTESLLVQDVEGIIAKMMTLKAKGVGFSLDDFGTGYSSLSYLKRLPLDQLKIDQGFVRDILSDPNDAAIAKMVVALAESMGLTVIAEGVEQEAQREFLARQGCHAYQGYLFGRPLSVADLEEAIASR